VTGELRVRVGELAAEGTLLAFALRSAA
jgi:hypothetical protein